MKSSVPGKNISEIEVTSVDKHGFWILIQDKEYFLPYQDFPWFQEAKIKDILNVELLHDTHLYWPTLDVDLDINSLEHLEKYPLVYH